MLIKFLKRFFLCAALAASFLLFSAFTGKSSAFDTVSRYELALMVDEVLSNAFDRNKIYDKNSFSDMSAKQNESILLAVKLGVFSGYADGTFRPCEKIRNIETVTYLQKLAGLLIGSDPDLYASKQLMRLFAYNASIKPGDSLPDGVFPQSLRKLGEFSDRATVCNVFEILKKDGSRFGFKQIECKFVNAATGKPISKAFAAINGNAFETDEFGKLAVSVDLDDDWLDLFAASEGYETIDIKKDIAFDRVLLVKMIPQGIKH